MYFDTMYFDDTLCPLRERCMATLEHLINCQVMLSILLLTEHIVYEHIDGSDLQQAKFLQVYENFRIGSLLLADVFDIVVHIGNLLVKKNGIFMLLLNVVG